MNIWVVVGVGVLVHLIFFFSVFEIYFATPFVNGMTPRSSRLPSPAKRVMFIVADGLRADKVLQNMPDGSTPAPFLRDIIKTKGAWGVSHAAVPTATRPGHVALTAGFYEDPTSVAKDIQGKNIVFDTVFNESRYTWSWDTPKFLVKVTGGAEHRMFSKTYPGDMKYLAGINAADMDDWVLTETLALFDQAKTDEMLKGRMAEDKVLFFLHLGGLDHSGYIVRPNSKAYLNHITLVDRGIKAVVEAVEKHYDNDGKTAYVFTSDHGMTDWGAHGDGTLDETLTPLIAWGPGIRTPEAETQTFADGLSHAWSLSEWKRTDIQQGSIACLLAALAGIPYPMNSILPVPDQLFNISPHEMAEMLLANLYQLLNQYKVMKEKKQEDCLKITFSEYQPLTEDKVEEMTKQLENLIKQKEFDNAIKEIKSNIELTLKGIRYFQTYDRFNIWFSIVSAYIGWIVFIIILMMEEHSLYAPTSPEHQLSQKHKGLIVAFFMAISIITFFLLFVQSSVWMTYFYILLPYPIWLAVCLRTNAIRQAMNVVGIIKPLLPYILLTFVGLELIVLCFYYRWVTSLVLMGCAVWPWVMKKEQVERRVLFQWSVSCLVMGFFPMLPVGERDLHFNLVILGGVLAIILSCYLVKIFLAGNLGRRKLVLTYGFQICVIAISIIIMRHTAYLAANDRRTPLLNQTLSWVILLLAFIEPLFVTTDIRCRLLSIALAWFSPFVLLGITYEMLFLLAMCWNLYLWIKMEAGFTENYKSLPTDLKVLENGNGVNGKGSPEHNAKFLESLDFATASSQYSNGLRKYLERSDLRRAFYFVFLIVTSLFGVGNVASVNSFDPAAIYCFLTISNPPSMGVLIVLKICIPFLYIGAAVRTINLVSHVDTRPFVYLLMLMCDIPAFHLFLCVTDEGSWVHVGETLSHYIIFQIMNMVIMMGYAISYVTTTSNICCLGKKL